MLKRRLLVGPLLCCVVQLGSVRSASACNSVRPTDDGIVGLSYGGAPVQSMAAEGVRVWFAVEGQHAASGVGPDEVPQEAVYAAEAAAEAQRVIEAELGFDAPISDAALECSNGGDGLVDVYLLDFAGADGHAGRDDCDLPAEAACSGFLLVENDFVGSGYASVEMGFQVVVPHEYFHLVQAAYAPALPDWWSEGTAQWAANHVYPELTDLEGYLDAYFDNPSRPIDLPPNTAAQPFSYGAAIWPVFLEEYFDVNLVREIFETLRDEPELLVATELALSKRGSTLSDAFSAFTLYNAATGRRSSSTGYLEAARYPEVPVEVLAEEVTLRHEGITSGLSAVYFEIPGGQARWVRVETDAARSRGWIVPLEQGAARLDQAQEREAEVDGPALVVIAGANPSWRDAPFVIEVQPKQPSTSADAGDADSSDPAGVDSRALANEAGCAMGLGASGGAIVPLSGLLAALWFRRRGRVALLANLLLGCAAEEGLVGSDAVEDPDSIDEVEELPGENIRFEVSADEYTLVSLERAELVAGASMDSGDWDVAFRAWDVFTNGGASGSGRGAAFGPLDELNFLFGDTPNVPLMREDRTGGAFLDWYDYGGMHELSSRYHTYGVDVAGVLWKLQILSYYGEQAGAPVSAIYRIRYAQVRSEGNGPIEELSDIDATAGYPEIRDDEPSACVVLVSAETLALTPEEASDSSHWDLCFRRDSISVNGGAGGPGGVTAVDLDGKDTLSESEDDDRARTAESELAAFLAIDFERLSAPELNYRGDRIVSIFDDHWFEGSGSGAKPAPFSWLVRGADGESEYLMVFRTINGNADAAGEVNMQVRRVEAR